MGVLAQTLTVTVKSVYSLGAGVLLVVFAGAVVSALNWPDMYQFLKSTGKWLG